jgi:hypothetical protein
MSKDIETTDETTQALFICLKSGGQVIGNCGPVFLIPGGRAMWWCCTMCKVWHVAIKNEKMEGAVTSLTAHQQQ